ncbi:MAG: DUF2442 domain-containing protein [Venatoribacter sp.]
MNKQFIMTKVTALVDHHLALSFADGATFELNLAPLIKQYKSLAALKNADVFAKVALGEGGYSLQWLNGEIELAGDNLRAKAIEQAGGHSHELVWNWMSRNKLSLTQAADAIGISRRMLAYYRSGEREIPKTVALAMIGWEVAHRKAA